MVWKWKAMGRCIQSSGSARGENNEWNHEKFVPCERGKTWNIEPKKIKSHYLLNFNQSLILIYNVPLINQKRKNVLIQWI